MTDTALPSPTNNARAQRLPWPYTGAAVVALFALYWSGKGFLGPLVLAAFLLLASFVPLRLPPNRILGWVLRVAMWVVIVSLSPERHAKGMAVLVSFAVNFSINHLVVFRPRPNAAGEPR